jgi:hypothetical protein
VMFFVIIYLARGENNNPYTSAPAHLANKSASGVDLNAIMWSHLTLASRAPMRLGSASK